MSFPEYVRAVGQTWPGGGSRLVVLKCPASTHQLARRIVREYAEENVEAPACDFLAWQQNAGRGREGRRWLSPPGAGVYVTLIRPLSTAPRRAARAVELQTLPVLVACALAETVNERLGGKCQLKWPNDLMVEGRKLGGILIDVMSRAEDAAVSVISFGVNQTGDSQGPRTTSMADEGATPVGLAEFAAQLVAAVDRALAEPVKAEDTVAKYRTLSHHRVGETLSWRAGGETLKGIFRGFDHRGFVRLEVSGKERLLTAGEVTQSD